MSTRVVDRVEDWEERSFTDGYRSLHELADEQFSGVVRAGGAELYMTKGTVVGIRHGSIEDFEDTTGTAYEAPSPALALLAVMQETSDEVRAEYYSEKTSISEVDSTLSDGGFTGYIELSDNVLSGDYYQVYHAGQSMSVGFIGSSSRLIDGDEAFETANDEVGIYQVRPADIEVVELPEVADTTETTPATSNDETPTTQVEDKESETDEETADSETAVDDETQEGEATEREQTREAEDTGESAGADASDTERDDERSGDGETAVADTDRTADEPSPSTADASADSGSGSSQTETTSTERESTSTGRESSSTETESASAESPGSAADETSTDSRSTAATGHQPDSARADSEVPSAASTTTDQHADTARDDGQSERTATSDTQETRGQSAETVVSNTQGSQTRQPTTEQHTQPRSQTQQGGQSGRSTGTSGPDLDLETRAIPSLDPERTSEPEESGGSARSDTINRTRSAGRDTPQSSAQRTQQSTGTTRQQPPAQADTATTQSGQSSRQAQPAGQETEQKPTGRAASQDEQTQIQSGTQTEQEETTPSVDPERIEELESEISDRDDEIKRLESELDRKTTEYEDAKSQLEQLRTERDELTAEVERLESELEQLETQFGAATDAQRRMTPAEALSQTDIFPRYTSKGDATLKKAHSGSHRREDVAGNLRLEKNTQFDVDSVSVGGQMYDEFLESTLEYQFVKWVVGNLLFEIRETGHEKALKDLYDALPVIDWADLNGTVDVVYNEDGQETRSQESFDIILRNRMGEPLIVANLNDSREGATESMMENLVRAAERVGQSSDVFAGAFLVTRSFFEPPALETADDATKGGLLSRDKRKSFVNLSRKQGYHLCLVEARNENFTLLVPEL